MALLERSEKILVSTSGNRPTDSGDTDSIRWKLRSSTIYLHIVLTYGKSKTPGDNPSAGFSLEYCLLVL